MIDISLKIHQITIGICRKEVHHGKGTARETN